ncbi:hypothetical protein [Chryseobacterium sp.]|uniref:hypothetical protein n=1 Tax=Chryseobacterium sp. TaxID=1871047 RepID=UPI0012A7F7BA|nr:hypothetical protein [Chryseobacterium sp.]QFG53654.1 hypothetical protein F7R58_08845 [Chryseobacterium sp.]
MKKLLLFLLFPFLAFTQINIDKTCALSQNEARKYADEVVALSKDKFRFFTIENRQDTDHYIYVPAQVTDADIGTGHNYMNFETVEVVYKTFMDGKNADLKIPGVKTYRMERVHGQFLNIFPFWQKYYVPEATTENYKDYQMRELRKGQMLVKFVNLDEGYWYIDNVFCAKTL